MKKNLIAIFTVTGLLLSFFLFTSCQSGLQGIEWTVLIESDFDNSWDNATGYYECAYGMDGLGIVYLRGETYFPVGFDHTPGMNRIFVIPEGFRPSYNIRFDQPALIGGIYTFGNIVLSSNGDVRAYFPTNAGEDTVQIFFEGIVFEPQQ